VERLILVGVGKIEKLGNDDWLRIGGAAFSKIGKSSDVAVALALPEQTIADDEAADFALGMLLRSYEFDKYKTKKDDKDGGKKQAGATVKISVASPDTAKAAYKTAEAVADGVIQARDLVNEPANILGPVEFADEAAKLEKLGVK